MVISAFSPASIWNSVTRTLTGLGSGALQTFGTANGTIAAAATLSFAQVAGKVNFLTAASTADASGTVVIQVTDSTNTWTVTTIAAGATGGQDTLVSAFNAFWQIHNNSATVAAKVWYTGCSFSQ